MTIRESFRAAAILLLGFCSPVSAQSDMNPVLLGVITAPAEDGITVLYVLEESPAAKAGLLAGDVLRRVGHTSLNEPGDLDAALSSVQPGVRVGLEWSRGGKPRSGEASVVNWRSYRGGFLRGRARGQTGFAAPDWYAYGWERVDGSGHVSSPASPPTRENTAGKVVVIHAFQSW